MLLRSIVYVSAARPGFCGPAVTDMVERARARNAALDVTGCLLHYDGSFMQYLEGPPENVRQLYRRILADPRHHQIVEMHQGEHSRRAFTGWTMQLAQPGDAAWDDLYRLTQPPGGEHLVPALRPLLGSFLISGDRYRTFRA